MRRFGVKRVLPRVLCAAALAFGLGVAPSAQAAFPEPDFVFFASQNAQPGGDFSGPCGLAVDVSGRFYVADYYHHAVDVYNPNHTYVSRLKNEDPLDGPCGLALDVSNNLYVNNYHRNVAKFGPTSAFTPGPIFDTDTPTGVAVDQTTGNVYVNDRTYIAVYDSTGAPVLDGLDPKQIGVGSLGDGYGLAISQFAGTFGRLYVPDASTDTVKVYDSATGASLPAIAKPGGFGSLRDSAVAVDRVTGEVYVADTLGSQYSEHPQATIWVFSSTGVYEGRLKYNVVDGAPPGLAVDNSAGANQGRVYVTSGNTDQASVYAYPPGSATSASAPAAFSLAMGTSGSGGGAITASSPAPIDCTASCDTQIRSGAVVDLSADPDPNSTFTGWSGEGCSGGGECTVTMDEAKSVSAEFEVAQGNNPPAGSGAGAAAATKPSTPLTRSLPAKRTRHRARRHHHRRPHAKRRHHHKRRHAGRRHRARHRHGRHR